jgi:hypothetical protein
MIMVLFAFLLPILLGLFLIAWLLRNEHETSFLERLSLSYPLGMGLLTMQMFFLGLLRVPLTLGYSSFPILLEILALFLIIRINKTAILPAPSGGLFREITSSKNSGIKKTALIILSLWAGAKVLSLFFEAGLRPIFAWDAWANWSAGAKLFFYTKGLMLDAAPQDFFARGAVLRIQSYPLHSPLLQVWFALWTGHFDEVVVKLWAPAYLLCTALYLYSFAVREINRTIALIMLVLFLSSNLMSYHAVEAYSDFPLGSCLMFALASFLMAIRRGPSYWIVVGLFCAQSLFIKEEAVFYVLLLLLSAIVYIRGNTGKDSGRTTNIVLLLAPLVLILPWFLFKYSHGFVMGAEKVRPSPGIHPEMISQIISLFTSLDNFNVVFIFFPALLLIAGKPTREFRHLLFAVAGYMLFFFALYSLTSYATYIQQGTIFFRNVLTYYPSVCLLTIMAIQRTLSAGTMTTNSTVHKIRKRKGVR